MMSAEAKAEKLLSISSDCSIKESLINKLKTRQEFTVFHSFIPNGRLTFAHALRYVIASQIVKECGGKYILFISDVRASQELYFDRNEEDIQLATNYALKVLDILGVNESNVQIIKSSEYSLNNYDLFYQMVSNSTKISINDVKQNLSSTDKKITASKLIAPCLQATEIQFLKADIVICSENHTKELTILKKFMNDEDCPVIIPLHHISNLKNTNPVKPDPKNTYFFEDDKSNIDQKSNGAYCTNDTNENPIFQYISFLFLRLNGEFEFNGKKYLNINEICADFPSMEKKILKENVASLVNKIIDPVRIKLQDPEFKKMHDSIKKFSTSIQ